MINGIIKIAAGSWGQLFSDRQIYLRSNGRVRYVSLTPGMQSAISAFGLLAFMWISFTSVNFFAHDAAVTDRDAQISEMQANTDRLKLELAQLKQQESRTAAEIRNGPVAVAPVAVAKAEAGAGAIAVKTDIGAQTDVLAEKAISEVTPRPRPEGRRSVISDNPDKEILPRERPLRPSISLPENMTSLGARAYAQDTAFGQSLSRGQESDSAKMQNDVIAYLASDAKTAVAALEKLINLTGLDADTMLRRQDAGASADGRAEGGPLLSVPPSMTGKFLRRNLHGDIALPSTRKGRLEMLREALFSLPLAEPVAKYYVSSGYGYRRDPFTHAKAFHSGVDMVAPHGDPVRSSAPGTVIFAGRNGPYGNMVEIDHGNGVKSRYGHLSRIEVTRGQKIGLHGLIGRVGNTGRSGTAHLHFEVWFDGKARDPRNFLKAGENVFQRKG